VGRISAAGLAYVFEPAAEVAGDYFDALPLADGSVVLCVADVTGHDVPAAMGAAMLKALFEAHIDEAAGPGALLESLNRSYSRVSLSEDFATMAILRWDPSASEVLYASAGHEPAFLLRAEGETVELSATGIPLGVVNDPGPWQTTRFGVRRGDRIVIFTDGLPEMRSPEGSLLGRGAARALLEKHRRTPLPGATQALRKAIKEYVGSRPPDDDITILIADLQPEPPGRHGKA
jgi:serine phosphatase RsbU (regulator of sigma subunit)